MKQSREVKGTVKADEIIPNVIEMPLCVFQLMQNQVNDYIDGNDIMEKYGDKDVPCGVVVKIEHNMSKPSYKCEIYDDSGEEAEKRISKIEPLTPLERTVFKAIEDCSSLETEYVKKSLCAKEEEQERYFLGLASIETLKANFLQDLISKAGLDETYQAWLKERGEREQPEEDAEEQENLELTEEYNHQAVELTPLERIIFRERDTCIERYSLFSEKAEEAENDGEYDDYRFDASVAIRIADYLEYIIMEVGLTEKWYSWLAERKKQEAVTVI